MLSEERAKYGTHREVNLEVLHPCFAEYHETPVGTHSHTKINKKEERKKKKERTVEEGGGGA